MRQLLVTGFLLLTFVGCMERPPNIEHNSSQASKVVMIAKSHLGKPYRYGATGPNSFDCSGFVYGVFQSVGVALPRTSLDQSKISGSKLRRGDLKVGDLVFFDTSGAGHVNHSGIYLGNDAFIHASSGKAYSVTTSSLNGWYKDKFKWGKRIK
ncbi:MAG TPA: peptidoglycan endopeptidase [Campylobacterales bacterium]|nr:peptidoglycan endopeptidase [Campylobacterales bacterium]